MTVYAFGNANGTTAAALGLVACTVNDGITGLEVQSGVLTSTSSGGFLDFISPAGDANSHGKIVMPVGSVAYYAAGTVQRQTAARCRSTVSEIGYRAFPVGSASDSSITSVSVRRGLFGFIGNIDLSGSPINLATTALTLEIWADDDGDVHCIVNGAQTDFAGSAGNDASGDPVLTGGRAGGSIYNNLVSGGAIDSFDDGVSASTATVTPAQATVTVAGLIAALSNFTNVRIREVLVNAAGSPVGNRTGISLLVWYEGYPIGAPDLSYSNMTTDANGTTSWSIATGPLVYADPIFYVANNGVAASLSEWTCARMVPTYS